MKNLKQFREDAGYAAKIKAKKELKLKKGTTLKIMPYTKGLPCYERWYSYERRNS